MSILICFLLKMNELFNEWSIFSLDEYLTLCLQSVVHKTHSGAKHYTSKVSSSSSCGLRLSIYGGFDWMSVQLVPSTQSTGNDQKVSQSVRHSSTFMLLCNNDHICYILTITLWIGGSKSSLFERLRKSTNEWWCLLIQSYLGGQTKCHCFYWCVLPLCWVWKILLSHKTAKETNGNFDTYWTRLKKWKKKILPLCAAHVVFARHSASTKNVAERIESTI